MEIIVDWEKYLEVWLIYETQRMKRVSEGYKRLF